MKYQQIQGEINTLMEYQKFKHSFGCSTPLNPGVIRKVVANVALVSSDPAIAKFLSADPV